MRVFVSWSGERSQSLAKALHEWLPLVLHYVEPWLSEADIAAGDRWAQEVAKELEASSFGIICVTPENVSAPWILFEAGALAKSMQGARVVPLLYGLDFADISGPLAQFQAKKLGRAGVSEIVASVNQAAGDQAVPDDRARQLFQALWPKFEDLMESIPDKAPTERHMRPQTEVLEELVAGVRGLDGRFRELEGSVSERNRRGSKRRRRLLGPRLMEELAFSVGEQDDDPIGLLMVGSLLRDDYPWLYEVVLEVYRELRDGKLRAARQGIERLHRLTRSLGRGPLAESFGPESKQAHILMMEFPMFLDHLLHRYIKRQEPIDADSEVGVRTKASGDEAAQLDSAADGASPRS